LQREKAPLAVKPFVRGVNQAEGVAGEAMHVPKAIGCAFSSIFPIVASELEIKLAPHMAAQTAEDCRLLPLEQETFRRVGYPSAPARRLHRLTGIRKLATGKGPGRRLVRQTSLSKAAPSRPKSLPFSFAACRPLLWAAL
jgi:hypothetical protein